MKKKEAVAKGLGFRIRERAALTLYTIYELEN